MKYSIRKLDQFNALFRRLARRAEKLGLPSPFYAIAGERMEQADVFEVSEGESRRIGTESVVMIPIY